MDNRKSSTFNFRCFKAFKTIQRNLIKTFTVDRYKEFAGYAEKFDFSTITQDKLGYYCNCNK